MTLRYGIHHYRVTEREAGGWIIWCDTCRGPVEETVPCRGQTIGLPVQYETRHIWDTHPLVPIYWRADIVGH